MNIFIPGQDVIFPDPPDQYDDRQLKVRVSELEARVAKLEISVVEPPVTADPTLCFSPSSFWYKKLDLNTPLNQASPALVADFIRQTKPGGGIAHAPVFISSFAPSVYVVKDAAMPLATVTILNANPQVKIQIRIPESAVPTGTTTDGPMAVLDVPGNHYADFFQMKKVGVGQWTTSWGGDIANASLSDGIFKYPFGAAASGLPQIGHIIKLSELKAGVIPHVIGVQVAQEPDRHVWPANRHDNAPFFPNAMPHGTRYRLPADIFIDPTWKPITRMVAIAMRDYGMVQFDRAYGVGIPIENTAQYGETLDQFCGGIPYSDPRILAGFPWNKMVVLQ